ncbi:HU family DNA-binding protein [Candidatus Aminicenantes bacterium AC-335-B20]|jgi:DNA-binding protein HU-beta|nr:HU family DNA-binding protein [SCandidatus Aminicenantes bacterium Aminicenantia_JdfR_composite]MCP2596275.1 HU family DNA-binding protein [Candidatus Aminicenantes bacterium AC-335-G13]MCP2597850.1 HU family DNA-binding protein [Candidatus Aminicenantes bacterium AC-335-L06]MCP2599056.1 HU family DNA-binding protein [Candidatus Aminicenantes bacterium AC-335-B20]MCP2605612.1 HU family DNA-binding protein [Candidatus Aminicenantes bacterium AC-335-O07]
MNKRDIVTKIAKNSEITIRQAEKALSSFLLIVEEALKRGTQVKFAGFGTFSVIERKARKGRNPCTGEEIKIPERKIISFKPSRKLLNSIQ